MAASTRRVAVERERRPDLRRPLALEVGGQPEIRRHHADHRAEPAVQLDGSAHHRGVAAEAALPQPVAEQRDIVAARKVLLRGERPPEQRPTAQRLEEVGRHLGCGNPLRLRAARQVRFRRTVGGELLKAADRFPVVEQFRPRKRNLFRGGERVPDGHHPVRPAVRQRPQQHRVEDAHDCAVGADPERQRDHRHSREPGPPGKLPESEAEVLSETIHR
jgi:hypothetical protein